jgi:hypothetical protein
LTGAATAVEGVGRHDARFEDEDLQADPEAARPRAASNANGTAQGL